MKTELSFRTIKMMMSSVSDMCVVPVEHLGQVLSHGVILSFIIMGFWLLDSLKDPILENFLGMEYQPTAKILSVLTTLLLVCIYDYLTSVLKKSELFHLISILFGILFMILSALVSDPVVGLANRNKGPHRYVGWLFYFSIEAYGSLMVAMFWSYTNAVMDLEQAKGAYGLIIAIAQVGAIIGATLATHSSRFGIAQLILVGAMIVLSVSLLIKAYYIVFKAKLRYAAIHDDVIPSSGSSNNTYYSNNRSNSNNKSISNSSSSSSDGNSNNNNNGETVIQSIQSRNQNQQQHQYQYTLSSSSSSYTLSSSSSSSSFQRYLFIFHQFISNFYEGFLLIWRYNYVMKLLLLSCLYEIVITILDYEFKLRGAHAVAIQSAIMTSVMNNNINNNNNDDYMNSNINNNNNDNQNNNYNNNNYNINTNANNNNNNGSENQFAILMGHFGQLTNFLSLLISIFIFTLSVKRLGVKSTLMIFPLILMIAVIILNLVSSLSLLFICISLLKALIFSLNEPVKELLYIPTSDAIKFRAKAWIDVFGSRLAKAVGSMLTTQAHGDIKTLKMISELPCIVLSIGVIAVAWSVGTEFEYCIRHNQIIGVESLATHDDDDDDDPSVFRSANNNTVDDNYHNNRSHSNSNISSNNINSSSSSNNNNNNNSSSSTNRYNNQAATPAIELHNGNHKQSSSSSSSADSYLQLFDSIFTDEEQR